MTPRPLKKKTENQSIADAVLRDQLGEVLPALGVHGVKVQTFTAWAETHRRAVMPLLDVEYDEIKDGTHALLREIGRRPDPPAA